MEPFRPIFRNPHLQTILGNYWPRPKMTSEQRLVTTEPGIEVLIESQYPVRAAKGAVLLVHGLEGSSQAGYMRSLSAAAVHAGYAAHRLNMRPKLYHAGLTADLLAVMRELDAAPYFLAGFSLGGNIVLKLAGELGASAAGSIAALCAVSTPLDLAACVECIGRPSNRIYEQGFVRRMRQRMRSLGLRDGAGLRTIFDIDNRITAPAFQFGDAPNYYRTQSAIHYLADIRIPALLIHAKDDPFIPYEIYQREAVRANPNVEVLVCEHGGHLGFLGRRPHRLWLDAAIMEWFDRQFAGDPSPRPRAVEKLISLRRNRRGQKILQRPEFDGTVLH